MRTDLSINIVKRSKMEDFVSAESENEIYSILNRPCYEGEKDSYIIGYYNIINHPNLAQKYVVKNSKSLNINEAHLLFTALSLRFDTDVLQFGFIEEEDFEVTIYKKKKKKKGWKMYDVR